MKKGIRYYQGRLNVRDDHAEQVLTLTFSCQIHIAVILPLDDVTYPTIQVTTLYPGASPEVISQVITAPLERQFGEMPGLARMS